MQKLLTIFASADHAGMAKRLFDGFQSKKPAVEFFDDVDLNVAAARHANIQFFCDAALSAPNVAHRSTGKVRIHQALKSAGWDITKLVPPSDLGVPAFNIGNPSLSTGDFRNGLGVMVNGIQYAYVMAQSYPMMQRQENTVSDCGIYFTMSSAWTTTTSRSTALRLTRCSHQRRESVLQPGGSCNTSMVIGRW